MTGRKEKHPGAAVPKNAVGADVGGTLQPQAIGNKWTAMGQSIWVVPRKVCLSSRVLGRKAFYYFLERCDRMIVSTTPTLEGMQIVSYLNIVYGEVIMATDVGQDFIAGFSNFFGGRSGTYEEALSNARQDAINEMKMRAKEMGANAIVGVDIDYESHAQMLMVIASGTAVVVETSEKE